MDLDGHPGLQSEPAIAAEFDISLIRDQNELFHDRPLFKKNTSFFALCLKSMQNSYLDSYLLFRVVQNVSK